MYKVKSNIKHNGQLYAKGDTIELDEKEAKDLIADGVLYGKNGEGEDKDSGIDNTTAPHNARTKAEKEAQRQAKKGKDAHDKAMDEANDNANKDDDNKPVDDGLEELTKAELMDIVEKEEIEEVTEKMVKDDIVEAIRVARAAKADNNDDL